MTIKTPDAGPLAAATWQDRLTRERDVLALIQQRRTDLSTALEQKRQYETARGNLGSVLTRYASEEAAEKIGNVPSPSHGAVQRREADQQEFARLGEQFAQAETRCADLDAELRHLVSVELPLVSAGCGLDELQAAQYAVSQARDQLQALRAVVATKQTALADLAPVSVDSLKRQLEDLLARQALSTGSGEDSTVTDSLLRTQIDEVEAANAQKVHDAEDIRAALSGLARQVASAEAALADKESAADRVGQLFLKQYAEALAQEYLAAAETAKTAFLRLVGLHHAFEGNGVPHRVLTLDWYRNFVLARPFQEPAPGRAAVSFTVDVNTGPVLFTADTLDPKQRYELAAKETACLSTLGLDIVTRRARA